MPSLAGCSSLRCVMLHLEWDVCCDRPPSYTPESARLDPGHIASTAAARIQSLQRIWVNLDEDKSSQWEVIPGTSHVRQVEGEVSLP